MQFQKNERVGIDCVDWDISNPKVSYVDPGSQADKLGVQVFWKIWLINDQDFNIDLLDEIIANEENFTLTFLKPKDGVPVTFTLKLSGMSVYWYPENDFLYSEKLKSGYRIRIPKSKLGIRCISKIA